MKQIDLEPKDYKRRDPDGVFRRRHDPKFSGVMAGVGVLMLGYLWWNAGDINPNTLFWAVCLIAVATGIMIADFTRNIY